MKIEPLKIEAITQSTPQSLVEEAQKKAESGHFYSMTRHYVVQEIVQGKVGRAYDVSLNIVERIITLFLKLFRYDYIGNHEPFRGKEIKVLSATTAGLPAMTYMLGAPQPEKKKVTLPVAGPAQISTVPPVKPDMLGAPQPEKKKVTLPVAGPALPSRTQPSPKSASDDPMQRIVCRRFSSSSSLPPMAEIQDTAAKILEYIEEHTASIFRPSSLKPDECYLDLSEMSKGGGRLGEEKIEIALNYLLLTDKIGFYSGSGKVKKVCSNPKTTDDPSERQLTNKQRLVKIDQYMLTHLKAIEELKETLVSEGMKDPKLLDLLAEIESFHYLDAEHPEIHEISSSDKKPYLDLLVHKHIILAWADSRGEKTYVALNSSDQMRHSLLEWRTSQEVAADNGDVDAMLKFVEQFRKSGNFKKSAEWLLKAAESGNVDAMYAMGKVYWEKDADSENAVKWWKRAAEEGNLDAMVDYGRALQAGDGVKKDIVAAEEWYQKAADGGNTDAMICIGTLFWKGRGQEKDIKEALRWYQKAAAAGSVRAMLIIGDEYLKGNEIKKDVQEALQWYQKAAEKKSSHAMVVLGRLFLKGDEVKKDITKAKEWFQKAVALGDYGAALLLKDLEGASS